MEQEQIDKLLDACPGQRVTKEYIESRIVDTLFTGLREGSTVMVCQLTLDNGFSVRGENTCVDPVNYNMELGKHYAHADAFRQLWPLFGFLLAEEMFKAVAFDEHHHEGEEPAFSVDIEIPDDDEIESRAIEGVMTENKLQELLANSDLIAVVGDKPTLQVNGETIPLVENSFEYSEATRAKGYYQEIAPGADVELNPTLKEDWENPKYFGDGANNVVITSKQTLEEEYRKLPDAAAPGDLAPPLDTDAVESQANDDYISRCYDPLAVPAHTPTIHIPDDEASGG